MEENGPVPHDSLAHVQLANSISKWLISAGVKNADHRATLAVGLADSLHAMEVSIHEIRAMIATDPASEQGASESLSHSAALWGWFFGELKDHMDEMVEIWEPVLESQLESRLSPQED